MNFTARKPQKSVHWCAVCLICLFMSASGCVEKAEPPFVAMRITLQNGDTFTVKNCKFHYWWQERGETAFLKQYHLYTKDLIVQAIEPIDNQTRRVRVQDRRIDIASIDTIYPATQPEKPEISIKLTSGELIPATDDFPRSLKKGKKTGLADYALFLEGEYTDTGERKQFKKKIFLMKKIEVLSIEND